MIYHSHESQICVCPDCGQKVGVLVHRAQPNGTQKTILCCQNPDCLSKNKVKL